MKTPRNKHEHYIVAIGASAGGLEAIHEFFDSMPETPDISFIIIQHLSPDYKSLLVELVARHTDMKVYEAGDHMEVDRKCVYVIPNTKLITIQKNKLRLSDKQNLKLPNNAVDVFLYSLAKEKKTRAVAVILSGTGTDGTKGTEAIKREGGLVIVQDPSTAKFDGMPNSAIAAGNADYILPPAAIYTEIAQHISPAPAALYGSVKKDEQFLQTVFDLIRQESGMEFHFYKTPTIIRRITKRMMQGSFTSPDTYAVHLKENRDEVRNLGHDFLIGVTNFFRDPEAFGVLRDKVIKEIIDRKEEDEAIKIWVTACSTGEEAYTIAMLVDDVLEKSDKNLTVKIFASDIDEEAIQFASIGAYPASVEKDIPAEYLRKYFTTSGKSYTIIPRIRKQIVFSRHNIVKDPPFIKNDLVSCRNMLIYISPSLQQRIFSLLLFAAGSDGFIFLGPSENSAMLKKDVEEVSARWKIYRKTAESRPGYYYQQGLSDRYTTRGERGARSSDPKATRSQSLLWDDFRQVVMDDLSYVVLYIDTNFDIRETIGPYEKFFTLPRQQLHLNLLRMLPSGISIVVSAEVRKAEKNGQKTTLRNIRYEKEGSTLTTEIFIRPGGNHNGGLPTMIVFRELPAAEPAGIISHDGNGHHQDDEYVQAMEAELADTRTQLQLAVEDLEATNEELQSANEELLSANEELQSSNEELQSLNEELMTLNTEHQLKIKELLELNDDLNNYFRSTEIAQVFLDNRLLIRKFNPASSRMINFIESDIGRSITHISNNIRSENLLNDVQTVLQNGRPMEKEVQLISGKNLLMRILPYLTHEGKNDGVTIAFVDITAITDLNNIIRAVFNSSPSAIFAFQACRDSQEEIIDFTLLSANYAANAMVKRMNQDLKGFSLKKDLPQLTTGGLLQKYTDVVRGENTYHGSVQFKQEGKWFELTIVKMMDGFVATFTNITDRKIAEERLRNNYAELIDTRETLEASNQELQQFASIASHDLQEPLRKIHMFSAAIVQEYGAGMPGEMRSWFEKIVRSTDRMRALIIDILNFSRLSADVSCFKQTNMRNMLKEVLEDFELKIRELNAEIHIGELPDLELIPSQFRQVLHNLLSNALKFIRPGTPPIITLEAFRVREKTFDGPPDPGGDYYHFTFTDNGIGFEEKFADNIFKLFQRLHPKDRFEGTGIGLAITKKIIDRHNGIITASSSEGKGARFDWVLPICQPDTSKCQTL